MKTATNYFPLFVVPGSDKRVTKCRFGHSELSIPTESATKEVSFSFETVQSAKVKVMAVERKVVVEWPFRKDGADRIYITLL